MGAFRDFFEGLFKPISEPLGKIKNELIGPDGFLVKIKDKILSIDDVFDEHVTGPLVEAIGNIGGLPAKLLVSIESLVSFLDGQKDNVIDFFNDFKGDTKNKAIAFHIERMQVCKCVDAVNSIYNAYPQFIKDYPGIKEAKNAKVEELTGAGMITFTDLGLNIVGKGIVEGVDAVTKNAYESLMPVFESLMNPKEGEELTPEEALKAIAGAGEFGLNAVVAFMLGHFLSPVLSTSTAPVWEGIGQKAWKELPVQLMDVQRLINLIHRFPDSTRDWTTELQKHGLSVEVIQDFKDEYKFYPSPNDLVTWLAKEVFEEDAVSKYGLMDEADLIDRNMFHKAGLTDDQIDNFWKAHWQHPSFQQITEMLHRGLLPAGGLTPEWSNYDSITAWEKEMEKEVFEWFRLVEIPPHWRDKLIAMSYNVPTRVDVRRWWDLKTITEPRLRELYHNMGYHGEDLEDYVLWTKIYTLTKDLRARYSKGYLTKIDVRDKLVKAGMADTRADEWTDAIVKATGEERIKKEKDYTKAEIYKGYKKGKLTRGDALDFIERLGYDEEEAIFLLDVNVGVLEGSPETKWELETIVSEFENTQGKHNKPVTKVLIELEKEYRADPKNKELENEYRQAMKDYYGV